MNDLASDTTDPGRARRRRTTRWAAAAGLMFLATACSGNAPEPSPATAPRASASATPAVDLSTFRRGEVPAEYPRPDLSALPPEPADSAPLSERIEWEALEEVTTFAHHVDRGASASCPDFDPRTDRVVTCTVTFLGSTFAYGVSIQSVREPQLYDRRTGKAAEPSTVTYLTDMPAGPIVRDYVESVLRYRHRTEYVLCAMPELARHRTDGLALTGITCRSVEPVTRRVTTVDLGIFGDGVPTFEPRRTGR